MPNMIRRWATGGLGRLAACYLDSMASLGIPGFGYGINYQFGLFKQKFENGYQIEQADSWLGEDSPWQFSRPDRTVEIPIYGEVENFKTATGQDSFIWMNTQKFYGVPYDFPIVGYDGKSVQLSAAVLGQDRRRAGHQHFQRGRLYGSG